VSSSVDVLILGAGPTGLGAAMRAEALGMSWQILEASAGPGGLASSFVDEQGFTWDLGGHVQFSHYSEFDRLMDQALGPDGWLTHERESWVRFGDRWVPYPFQYNIHRLHPADRDRCLAGLRGAAGGAAGSFGKWMDRAFGEGISELFMRPYNFKVWGFPPEEMDAAWMGDRVAAPDLNKVMRAIETGKDNRSWGPNATFRFPKRGGTGAIWRAVADGLPADRFRYRDPVVSIDPANRMVYTRRGGAFSYVKLISSLPLDQLIRLCTGVVEEGAADRLRYASTHVIGLGLRGQPPEALRGKCWMYFPGANSPYYRVTVFSHYSPENVPKPGEQWSLMAEVSETVHKPVDRDTLLAETVRAMREDGLLPDDTAILSTAHRFLPRGYPVPFLGRDGVVDPVLEAFEARGIFSRGRFGAWKYEVSNQDHSFMQGRECVNRIHSGGGSECEPTLHDPVSVNRR
jgi:protoporphyrinogen oxidase